MSTEAQTSPIRSTGSISRLYEVLISISNQIPFYEIQNDRFKRSLDRYLDHLRTNLYFFIEYPYVDKVYRDTYYGFYSTKNTPHNRETIRVSLFETELSYTEMLNNPRHGEDKGYLGYLIIRPTPLNQIGRSFLSTKALKNGNLIICGKSEKSLVSGYEFQTWGFPHATQDAEYHRCSQICLWEIMDYFSKYPEYKSVLPSEILKATDELNYERALPIRGLIFPQIAYFLKRMGFGVKVYRDNNSEATLKEIFNDYVESGIPIITILKDEKGAHHSVIAIGHEGINSEVPLREEVENASRYRDNIKRPFDSSKFYDKKYVFIDDNHPPYQLASFEKPWSFYPDDKEKSGKIVTLVVPLSRKIYIDSVMVRTIANKAFHSERMKPFLDMVEQNQIVTRYLLTKGSSFKRSILRNPDLDPRMKLYIENANLPRFIWLVEYSTVDNYLENKSLGFIIVDATGSERTESLIGIVWQRNLTYFDSKGIPQPIEGLKNDSYPLFIDNLNKY